MSTTSNSTTGKHDDLLFLGTFGHVLAVEKRTGKTAWTASLPKGGYALVSIIYEDDTLFCAAGGHLYALDPKNGYLLWRNDLKGMRHGPIYITTAQSSGTQAAQTLLTQTQQAAAGGTAAATSS